MHRRRDAVRRVDDRRALGHVALVLDEDRASRLEVADDVDVVDDLLADVHRRAVVLERPLDRLDGALDAGAVAARGGQQHAFARVMDREAYSRSWRPVSARSARGRSRGARRRHRPAAPQTSDLLEPDPRDDRRQHDLEHRDRPLPASRASSGAHRATGRTARSSRARPSRHRAPTPARSTRRALPSSDTTCRARRTESSTTAAAPPRTPAETPSAMQASERASRCAVACSPAR